MTTYTPNSLKRQQPKSFPVLTDIAYAVDVHPGTATNTFTPPPPPPAPGSSIKLPSWEASTTAFCGSVSSQQLAWQHDRNPCLGRGSLDGTWGKQEYKTLYLFSQLRTQQALHKCVVLPAHGSAHIL